MANLRSETLSSELLLDDCLDVFAAVDVARQRGTDIAAITVTTQVRHLSLAGRYIPAGTLGEAVAGDFFDVVPLSGGRHLIAIGDVSGHGLGAAAAMTRLRSDTRELALTTLSPVDILWQLDLDQNERHTDEIATLWVGIYHERTGVLRYSSAGHPPVVLAETDRPPVLLAEASAPPLGTGFVGSHAVANQVQLRVGTLLIAYSDGLVERPDRDLEDQIELLRATVGRAYGPSDGQVALAEVVQTILDELMPHTTAARDDVCLLVLRRERAAN